MNSNKNLNNNNTDHETINNCIHVFNVIWSEWRSEWINDRMETLAEIDF